MGWGTAFSIEIYLNKKTFRNIHEVMEEIREVEEEIRFIENQIMMFAVANPNDIVPEDWDSEKIEWINQRVSQYLSDLDESKFTLFQLNLYKQFLEEESEKNENNTEKNTNISKKSSIRLWFKSFWNSRKRSS